MNILANITIVNKHVNHANDPMSLKFYKWTTFDDKEMLHSS